MAKGECSTPSSLLSGLGQMAGPPFFPPLGIRRAGLQAALLGLSPRMRCRTSHRSRLAQEDPTCCKSKEHSESRLGNEAVVVIGPACRPDAAVDVALGGGLMI